MNLEPARADTPGSETEGNGVAGPAHVGYSLANVRELLFGCLEAAGPSSVLEVGAFRGELTRELLEWAAGRETRVAAIDPAPEPQLVELSERHPELELIRKTSQRALREIPPAEAVIIDGDHNYHTVSEELRLIDERAEAGGFPLVMFHDVAWPHARRDAYYDPERIPAEHRQPLAHEAAVAPGEPGIADAGIHYEWVAQREGGPRNGVLTAIEDFASGRQNLRLAVVPAFFGFGVVWSRDAPWAAAITEIVGPWDRNPLLARLEANRVAHLVDRRHLAALRERQAHLERQLDTLRGRLARHEQLLSRMLGSRAFGVAEWLSRLNQLGEPMFSREELRRALDDDG
jgi:hypothetical protein